MRRRIFIVVRRRVFGEMRSQPVPKVFYWGKPSNPTLALNRLNDFGVKFVQTRAFAATIKVKTDGKELRKTTVTHSIFVQFI